MLDPTIGPVSRTPLCRATVDATIAAKRRTALADYEWTFHVPEEARIVEETSISPGNTRTHIIKPGSYRVTFEYTNGQEWTEAKQIKPGYIGPTGPDQALVTLDTTITEQHSVNRIGAHARYHAEKVDRPGTLTIRPYAYEVEDGRAYRCGYFQQGPKLDKAEAQHDTERMD